MPVISSCNGLFVSFEGNQTCFAYVPRFEVRIFCQEVQAGAKALKTINPSIKHNWLKYRVLAGQNKSNVKSEVDYYNVFSFVFTYNFVCMAVKAALQAF